MARVCPEHPNPPNPPNVTRKSPDLARSPTIDAFSFPAASLSSGLVPELMRVHWNTPALASLHSSACVSGLASVPSPPPEMNHLVPTTHDAAPDLGLGARASPSTAGATHRPAHVSNACTPTSTFPRCSPSSPPQINKNLSSTAHAQWPALGHGGASAGGSCASPPPRTDLEDITALDFSPRCTHRQLPSAPS